MTPSENLLSERHLFIKKCWLQTRGSRARRFRPHRPHLTVSGDSFLFSWGARRSSQASSGQRPGTPLSTLPRAGRPPQQGAVQPQVSSAEDEKSCCKPCVRPPRSPQRRDPWGNSDRGNRSIIAARVSPAPRRRCRAGAARREKRGQRRNDLIYQEDMINVSPPSYRCGRTGWTWT